jgi:hypothetical protein
MAGDLPFAFHAEAPDAWDPAMASDPDSGLTGDQCVIGGERYFVRGLLVIPVAGAEEDFTWGVWVEVSEGSFERMSELWQTPNREREPPYPGWLANALPSYAASTLGMLARVKTRPVGLKPVVQVSADDHPLSVEQQQGIPLDRVREIAAALGSA